MSFEIEKKFFVGDFKNTLNKLENDYGDFVIDNKAGFWWAGNFSGIDNVLDSVHPTVYKKEVELLKDIGDFVLEPQNFNFVRLRIRNNTDYLVTFKTKELVRNVEQNIEYEYSTDKETFKRVCDFLQSSMFVFYYNIKKSYVFKKNDTKIELSTFSDLKNPYLEIEVTGENKRVLTAALDKILTKFNDYPIKEETKNYVELSRMENKNILKGKKISQYSRESTLKLNAILSTGIE